MPLEFRSLSHGPIAFGFFNIESDMLLLEHYFFFANDFCKYISDLSARKEGDFKGNIWHVYYIERPSDIGNLMGAIHGIIFQGFIGEVYKLFPFPSLPEGFKQKPDGTKNRQTIENLIQHFARAIDIAVVIDEDRKKISLGDYSFSRDSFQELIKYVWRGGYPRWQNEVRPDYVLAMKHALERSNEPLFEGIVFNG
jgi:hypothetical protein